MRRGKRPEQTPMCELFGSLRSHLLKRRRKIPLRTTMEQRREKQGLTVQANLGEMKQIGMGSHRDDRKYSELTYVYTRFDILICKNDLCKLYSQCALVFG